MVHGGAGPRRASDDADAHCDGCLDAARAVMERSPHVLLAGEGAARFARNNGFAPCPPASLVTARALERWRREREQDVARRPGTIGAVAVDRHGHVAAATSTGGISGKLVGRIGDSPIVGAALYADDRTAAASATGSGEVIMRAVMCKVACDAVGRGVAAQAAAHLAVRELEELGGEGGIILVTPASEVGAAFNSDRMSRAWVDASGREGVAFGGEQYRE